MAGHAMHRLSGRLDAWLLTSWHHSRGGIAHSCPHTLVTAARCLQWGGCVRALGMPGLRLYRHGRVVPPCQRDPSRLGAQRLHAHICTYESVRDARGVFCERVYTDPMESAQTRMARSWPVEGISTGSVQSGTVYDVFDSYADSHGPGSTGGRTQV